MCKNGSKSFRFLQIISAANKQYTGARAPDRQQAAALATCIPLRRSAAFAASLYSMLPLVFRFAAFAVFSAALAYSDIAAVCCDSRIVRWQDGIAPYIISVMLAAFAAFAVAAKEMVSVIAFMAVHSARVQRLLSGT